MIKINHPGHNMCKQRTITSQPITHLQENTFGKSLIKFFFTLLLASFASPLVNYSGHSKAFKIKKNSEIDDIFLLILAIFKHFASNDLPIWKQKVPNKRK